MNPSVAVNAADQMHRLLVDLHIVGRSIAKVACSDSPSSDHARNNSLPHNLERLSRVWERKPSVNCRMSEKRRKGLSIRNYRGNFRRDNVECHMAWGDVATVLELAISWPLQPEQDCGQSIEPPVAMSNCHYRQARSDKRINGRITRL